MIKKLLITSLILVSTNVFAQESIKNYDFESGSLKPWIPIGNGILMSSESSKEGNNSLEIKSGTIAQNTIGIKSLSRYKLSAYLKTSSGSNEIRLGISGLGVNNKMVASAKANWTLVELEFVAGEGQSKASIEIDNPTNSENNSAYADDVRLVYIGEYVPEKVTGIKPLPQREPKEDWGLKQQPNEQMEWLQDAKFGMFIHWGLYSGVGRGEWVMHNEAMTPENYRKLAYPESGDQYFDASEFDAKEWAGLAKDAGMKYMVMVTQHHDGYALFESKAIDAFTSKQTHNRDFVKEYVDACREQDLKVGIYKTLINWRYPGYYDVTGEDCRPNKFGYKTAAWHKENARMMKNELYVQTKELMTNYGKLDIMFWDGGWLAQEGSDADAAYFWESGEFLDPSNEWPVEKMFQDYDSEGRPLGVMGMVRKYQPNMLVNARSGWIGDFKSEEGMHPVTGPIRSEDLWEKCMPMASGWGFFPHYEDASKIISVDRLKRMLADCVMRDMVLLLNVSPDRHGAISEAQQNVLHGIGNWLEEVGDAVYGTRGGPWNPKDGVYGYTYKDNTIFVYLLKDFEGTEYTLPSLNKGQKVVKAYSLSDKDSNLKFKKNKEGETILSGIQKSDSEVTIIAIKLNKVVMP